MRLVLLVVLSLWSLLLTAAAEPSPTQASTPAEQHWQRPIQAISTDGPKPLPVNHDLYPQSCGQCHTSQYQDWRGSLHAKAMGPGVLGQLQHQGLASATSQSCTHCHAPLTLQQQSLQPTATETIHSEGIVCAACHVRNNQWFGPGRDLNLNLNLNQTGNRNHPPAHPPAQPSAAFTANDFCASCHQFGQRPPQIEGQKLAGQWLQNTYQEWQNSPFAANNINCQSCHMPGRRHLWRGIHDKSMVLQGLTITAKRLPQTASDPQNQINARLSVTNSGVGHYFPTYVTPRVILQGYLVDSNNKLIEQSLIEHEITRSVALDLTEEYFDTRLAPSERFDFDYQTTRPSNASRLILRIMVEPDHFYAQFYQQWLKQNPTSAGLAAIKQAKYHAQQSAYVLFEQRFDW